MTIEFKFNLGDKVKEIEGVIAGEVVEVRAYADGSKWIIVKTDVAQLRVGEDSLEIDESEPAGDVEAGEDTADKDEQASEDTEGEDTEAGETN